MDPEKIFQTKKSSNRGIADDQPTQEPQEQYEPSVLEILDAMAYFIDRRFNELESKLDKGCNCQKK
jgi:hypothetical protein